MKLRAVNATQRAKGAVDRASRPMSDARQQRQRHGVRYVGGDDARRLAGSGRQVAERLEESRVNRPMVANSPDEKNDLCTYRAIRLVSHPPSGQCGGEAYKGKLHRGLIR